MAAWIVAAASAATLAASWYLQRIRDRRETAGGVERAARVIASGGVSDQDGISVDDFWDSLPEDARDWYLNQAAAVLRAASARAGGRS